MRKYYLITAFAIIMTVYLQVNYINNLYNDYVINKTKMLDEVLYSSVDVELRIREIKRNDKIKSINNKANENNKKLGIANQKPTHNQNSFAFIFEKKTQIDLMALDSIFVSNLKSNFPHCFLKYDEDELVVEYYGDNKNNDYNYSTKLQYISSEGSHYIELKVDILISNFIKESILTLIFSVTILLLLLLSIAYQLTVIKRKTEQVEYSERNLNGIIHDLKSPLVSIFAMLNLLHMKENNIRQKKLISMNMAGVKNMSQNIESLLYIIQINRQKLILNKIDIDIDELIYIIEILKNDLSMSYIKKPHNIYIDNRIAKGTKIHADRMYLESVIRNLAENALKYSDDGVTVNIKIEQIDGMLRVSIKDDGWGIEKQHLKKLFNQFYRVSKNGQNTNGYGIGLSHVKYIIERHKGEISVKSDKNTGSVFTFLIPLEKDV